MWTKQTSYIEMDDADARVGLISPNQSRTSRLGLCHCQSLMSSDCASGQNSAKSPLGLTCWELDTSACVGQRILHDIKHISRNTVSPAEQHTNWCRKQHTRTSLNSCCHLVLHSLFVLPLANEKYKYLKYRITILQAVLHGWSKQRYGLRVFDSRLLGCW